MKILGINISHDSSSCLMVNGKVIYYIEEERLSKLKHHSYNKDNFKFYAIQKLKQNNIKHLDYVAFSSYRRQVDNDDTFIIKNIINEINNEGISIDNMYYNKEEHHLYHAYNGFYNSKFNDAAILICDGQGAYTDKFIDFREIDTLYYANKNNFNLIYKHISNSWWHRDFKIKTKLDDNILFTNSMSCGGAFTEICAKIGLNGDQDSGKLMGMSSYGKIIDKDNWVDTIDGFPYINNECINIIKNKEYASFQSQANLAKKVQYETKKYTINLIEKAIELTKSNNIVLSGGYFMNCVNNYEYIKAFPNVNFYVDPICYDGGTAIGACLYIWHNILGNENKLQKLDTLYLGGDL
jgi:carbamoyltransferase